MSRKIYFVIAIIITFLLNSKVLAVTSLYSFTLSNSNAISGQIMSLSWNGSETNGYILTPLCPDGIKLKQENGSVISCNSPMSTTAQNTDNLSFYITNISGSSKTVTFRIHPKNQSGQELTDLSQTLSVVVSPSTVPISSAALSTTTATTGKPVTVSWSSSDLDGVNFILECIDGITYTKQDGAQLSCGNLTFSEKLNGSGTQDIYFKNNNSDNRTIQIKILPYIGGGAYDSTHAVSLSLDVSSDKVQPYQIISFSAKSSTIMHGGMINLTWNTLNTSAVNIKIGCDESLAFFIASTTLQRIKCNELVLEEGLAPNSSVNFLVNGTTNTQKTIEISLLARLSSGGFDATNPKKISVTVSPIEYSSTSQIPKVPTYFIPTTNSAPTNSSNNNKKVILARKKFLKSLSLGSKGDDVSALQEFLRNNGYYPESLVTGYLGPATVKAIKRFQEQNNIAKSGQAGYGNFGPATRGKVNSF